MLWSDVEIPGNPRILMVYRGGGFPDVAREFSISMFKALRRRGLSLKGDGPLESSCPDDLVWILEQQDSFNCLFLVCDTATNDGPNGSILSTYWDWLANRQDIIPKLFAICSWDGADQLTRQSILETNNSFAKIALVPAPHISQRAMGLYYMKFFSELNLHAHHSINGKMTWFSHAKATYLLKRIKYPNTVDIRC